MDISVNVNITVVEKASLTRLVRGGLSVDVADLLGPECPGGALLAARFDGGSGTASLAGFACLAGDGTGALGFIGDGHALQSGKVNKASGCERRHKTHLGFFDHQQPIDPAPVDKAAVE